MMNVMKRAWEIYRTLTGDHIAKLSAALRHAWKEVKKMAEETAAQMLNNFVENSTYNQIREFAEKFAEKLGIVLDGRMITIKSDIVYKSRAYATIEDVEDFVSTHFDCVSHGTWRTLAEVSVSDREAPKRRRRNRPVGDTMTDDDVRRYTESYFAAEEM